MIKKVAGDKIIIMKLFVYSIKKSLYEGNAEKLICTTPQGQITVLDHHTPLITKVTGPAVEIVDKRGEKVIIDLDSGVLEVRPESEVVLLVD